MASNAKEAAFRKAAFAVAFEDGQRNRLDGMPPRIASMTIIAGQSLAIQCKAATQSNETR